MKLVKLTLTNFKGVRSLTIEPDGKSVSIYGTNASGKTTVCDAISWLLFDKGSNAEPGFNPKTYGADGEEIHNLNNRVDGTFQLDDKTIITLAKDQSENWVKKRGSTSESFSGNQTDYYIDGVPVKKSEYESRINEICPIDKAQILSHPLYFAKTLDWKKRREILLNVCGDITDAEVINNSEEMRSLTKYLLKPGSSEQFYTVDECMKIASAKAKDIRKRLDEIPARIDEATKAFNDTTGYDFEKINATISSLQEKINEAISEKSSISESTVNIAFQQRMAEIQKEITLGTAKFIQSKNERLDDDRNRIREMKSEYNDLISDIQILKKSAETNEKRKTAMQTLREQLVSEYRNEESKQWGGNTSCPTCGQALPESQIESARAKFNITKSENLQAIRNRLETECSKAMISALVDNITATLEKVDELEKQAEEIKIRFVSAEDAIAPAESQTYESTDECAKLKAEISEIKQQLASDTQDISQAKNAVQAKIDALQAEHDAEVRKLLVLQANEQQQNRIAELEKEESDLQAAAEDAEYCLHLCEVFITTKVSMLDHKINNKFQRIRFRLFDKQINGGIKECCDVMIPSQEGLIPFTSANDASKFNAGLEIIATLSEFWGIEMPILVDNAERVVNLLQIGPQVIRLVVSADDQQLRMEVSE